MLDETFVTPDVSHQTLEPRSAMAYWQNGKVYIHSGTQSTAQTRPAIARWLNIDAEKVVFISEYTGGGFGSKVTGGVTMIIPALLSKKTNAPVMMRISREEETFIGRARPGFQGRMKVGFSKEGRILAVDMFVISDNGPYDAQGDSPTSGHMVSLLYQPQAMRWRGVTVLTNTPPRSAQSSPGGIQGISIIEPIIAKAARKLGLDQVAIRYINCPEGKAQYGPPVQGASARYQRISQGRPPTRRWKFNWQEERIARNPKRVVRVRGVGVSLGCYVGALSVLWTPGDHARWPRALPVQIGNLGPDPVIDVHRAGAEVLGVPWGQCDVVWGGTSSIFVHVRVERQPDYHAMTEPLRRGDGCRAEAAGDGEEPGRQTGGLPDGERARCRNGSAGMTLRRPRSAWSNWAENMVAMRRRPTSWVTKTSIAAMAGQGLVAAAKDKYPRDGITHSYVASFAEIEVDVETGKYYIVDFLAYADVEHGNHPARSVGGCWGGRSSASATPSARSRSSTLTTGDGLQAIPPQ